MRGIIGNVDRLLSMLEVRGDSVMILSEARKILGELYRMAEEKGGDAENGEGDGKS